MKKGLPIFLAGLLFVVSFVGLIQVAKVTGIWVNRPEHEGFGEGFHGGRPAGGFDQDGDSDKAEGQGQQNRFGQKENRFGSLTIKQYCQTADIDTECAISKLGISNDQLELTFSTLAQMKNTTTADLVSALESCQSSDGDNDGGTEGGDDTI